MKKRTIIYCSFIVTALLMAGCGSSRRNEQTPPSSDTQETTTPQSVNPSTEISPDASTETSKTTSLISEEVAKAIALEHADLVVEEVTFSKCELDREPEGTNYDIEFYTEDRLEYNYEIDAYSGDIISYEWDEDELFID